MQEADAAIKGFLYPHIPAPARDADPWTLPAQACARTCFATSWPSPMHAAKWQQGSMLPTTAPRPVASPISIAGMTDGYALIEHAPIFDSTPELARPRAFHLSGTTLRHCPATQTENIFRAPCSAPCAPPTTR